MKSFIVALSALFIPFSLSAETFDQNLNAAVQEQRAMISEFNGFDMAPRTQMALNAIITAINQVLREKGYKQLADSFQSQWDRDYSLALVSIDMFNLGDHKPMSAWLDGYYKKAQDTLGEPVMKLLHFDDIYVINYGVPVVMHPGGEPSGHDHWNQLEYQRHFIPFSAAVTYWGSYVACYATGFGVPAVKRWCTLFSAILRGVMKSTIGPKLSDSIYVKARGQKAKLDLNYTEIERYYKEEGSKISVQ